VGYLVPTRKIPLAENKFLQAVKGAENTKEKSRQCFICVGYKDLEQGCSGKILAQAGGAEPTVLLKTIVTNLVNTI
jgi:hypothetical protein